jgi:hypothetical protein
VLRLIRIKNHCLIVLAFLCLTSDLTAASRRSGKEIFQAQCARCHGRNGEGAKGEYEDPLRGTKNLEKLTRYIETSMPDDKPGTCTGANAQAVAKFLLDSFYSQPAPIRKKAARLELSRLTNKQYLTTVADLFGSFSGGEHAMTGRHGLAATYYNSHTFNNDKKAFDRIDPRVDFDFGVESPDKDHGTNQFSIAWAGSLLAEESGDYDFVLKTPNGARLWINDDEEPLIDAWVASGAQKEFKATLRLLGGRRYPLKLNFFKFKDKTGSVSLSWKSPHGAEELIPVRNLSPDRCAPTLVIRAPFPADDSSVGYERGTSISRAWDEAATTAAIEAANYAAAKLDALTGSKNGDTNRLAEVQAFGNGFVEAAFRQPLTSEQKLIFITNQCARASTPEEAMKRIVLLALKSPRFLYLGLPESGRADFSVAERLSFGLWDSLPDMALETAAANGALHTRSEIETESRRMLQNPRAQAKMQLFFHHWLQMDRVENLSKDHELFPEFTAQIIGDLRTSMNLFLNDVMWNDGSDYRNLLRANYLYLNNRLRAFYGIATNSNEEFMKVSFDSEERSGVLTHPYLLAAFSYSKLSSPIHRGVFLTRNIVGRSLRPPPMAMTFKDADFPANLTMRQKVVALTRPQACQTCHSVINPLGFTLEHFDAVGRFRKQDNNQPVDTVSEYLGNDGQSVKLRGARDVADYALASEQSQSAFIEQLFHHVVKQPAAAYGDKVLDDLRSAFVRSNFDMQKLLISIVTVSALPRTIAGPSPNVLEAAKQIRSK